MNTIVGVFRTPSAARRAVHELRQLLPANAVSDLEPASAAADLKEVPTTKDMAPVGGYIGGAPTARRPPPWQ
jgi:hypothetical protein